MPKNRYFSMIAVAAMVSLAACGGGDDAGETEVVEADTTAIQGMDTVSVPTAVPTTDSVVTTTTVDTIQGEVQDTAGGAQNDTTARP